MINYKSVLHNFSSQRVSHGQISCVIVNCDMKTQINHISLISNYYRSTSLVICYTTMKVSSVSMFTL